MYVMSGAQFVVIADRDVVIFKLLEPPSLPTPVSADPDDDKFLAAAQSAQVPVIVSGDRHLLEVTCCRRSSCSPHGSLSVATLQRYAQAVGCELQTKLVPQK